MPQTAQSRNSFDGKTQATVLLLTRHDTLYFRAVACGLPLNEIAARAE
jgi:hypothetical protein